jgi:hypothetical protein
MRTTLHAFLSPRYQTINTRSRLSAVCVVCVHVAVPAADLDARRIEDLVVDAMGVQQSMQPEAVISRLITAVDLDSRNTPGHHCLPGTLKNSEQPIDIAAGKLEHADLVIARQMERDHPAGLAEFNRREDGRTVL